MGTTASAMPPGAQYVPPNQNPKILTARPNVRFLSQAVQPPSNVYVELADVLRISAASSQANEVLTVNYRLLLPSGDVVEGQSSLAVTSNRAINIHDEPLAEGFLLSCSCKAAAATTRGQTFARIFLTNPVLGQGQPSYMLMADYVTTAMAPAHPNGRVLAPSEGIGWLTTFIQSSFTPGTDFQVVVPANARWKVRTLFIIFTTGAVVANRVPKLQLTDASSNTLLQIPPSGSVPANTVQRCSASPGLLYSAIQPDVLTWSLPPDCFLFPGGAIQSSTNSIQAADQWTFIRMLIEELIDNA